MMARKAWLLFAVLLVIAGCRQQPAAPRATSLSLAVPYETNTLDPHLSTTVGNLTILFHFYEPLMTMNPEMKIEPGLAQSWETPDAYTWIFHLRPGVKFHSGKKLTAEDVVYTFHRILENDNLETNAYLRDITDVVAQDPLTIRVRTATPISMLLNRLRYILIVPAGFREASVEKENGTGPYRLSEWRKGEWVRMVRFENYWGSKPDLTKVEFLLSRSPEEAIALLKSGRCRLVQSNSRALESVVAAMPGFRMLRSDSLFLKFLAFDTAREKTPQFRITPNPFRNRLVRRAIHLAIDRTAMINRLSTYSIPASQPVLPLVFGFNPRISAATHDPAAAKALLRQAGLRGGFHVSMHVREIMKETAFLVKEQLQQVGITVDPIVLSDEEFFRALRNGEASFYLDRFACSTGDASEVLNDAMHSVDPAHRLGEYNFGRYSDPELDRSIEELNRLNDPADRVKLLQDLMLKVTNDVVWVPLYFDQNGFAIENIYDWTPRASGGILAAAIHIRQP